MIPNYVRLTFMPAGATRRRTVWAEEVRNKGGALVSPDKLARFWKVNKEGERPEPQELIIVRLTDPSVLTEPAVMSHHYGRLVLLYDPNLDEELPR
jgi:hypothetical protein